MKSATQAPTSRQTAKEEARKIREVVDRMIERQEMRPFLVKHGFLTKAGKLTKRYGG
jgi:hypothetical protein